VDAVQLDQGEAGAAFDTVRHVHEDQLLSVPLHGTYAAERRNLAESIAELREIAGGRDDILAEAAGIQAGSWYAWPATHAGYELIAAGMLIMAGGGNGKTAGLRRAGAVDSSGL
jgi:hypothetical protein